MAQADVAGGAEEFFGEKVLVLAVAHNHFAVAFEYGQADAFPQLLAAVVVDLNGVDLDGDVVFLVAVQVQGLVEVAHGAVDVGLEESPFEETVEESLELAFAVADNRGQEDDDFVWEGGIEVVE